MEVLFWAIRIDDQGSERVNKLLRTEVNWSEIVRLAQKHQVSALLYHRLKSLRDSDLESQIDHHFKDLYWDTIHRNLIHSRQLLWILHLLSERGIQAIPFKGVVLAVQAYGTTDLRQCGDIDILVRGDLPETLRILREQGYSPRIPFTGRYKPDVVHAIMRSETFTANRRVDIDVHWKISDIFSAYPAENEFFSSAHVVNIFGSDIPAFSSEDTLIMLSAHAMKHFWPDMKSIADISHLISQNPTLDLQLALSKAENLRCRRLLFISLSLAQLLGGVRYERALQSALDADPVSLKTALYIARMAEQEETPEPVKRLVTMMRSREHLLDALRFGMYAVFSWKPPSSRIRLPRPLRPLYFFLRPVF
jgi:hypothetical protein